MTTTRVETTYKVCVERKTVRCIIIYYYPEIMLIAKAYDYCAAWRRREET